MKYLLTKLIASKLNNYVDITNLSILEVVDDTTYKVQYKVVHISEPSAARVAWTCSTITITGLEGTVEQTI